jgi:uncharacterized protein
MTLLEKIQEDLKSALMGKREIELSTLRMVLAGVSNREAEKRTKIWKEKPNSSAEELEKESKLNDEEMIGVISSEVKKRRESIVEFEKGKRQDLVKKEKSELEILHKYLPEQISEDEIKKLVSETIAKTGAKEIKDMGKVMGLITAQVKGKADMSLVSKIVKESLS